MIYLLIASLCLNFLLGFLLYRVTRRLVLFDELHEIFVHDIQVNMKYFNELLGTPLLNNSVEVRNMHHNMNIIAKRLDEFSLRMQELSGKVDAEDTGLERQ